jgi:peptidase C25-like protein
MLRKLAFGVVLALVAMFGAYGSVAAAQTSTAKVVIIVGADTPQYLDDANEVYAEAIKYTPNVVKVYSPNATWSAVKAATNGANVVVYMGHGNGVPSPYGNNPLTKNGFGLNTKAGAGGKNLTYYGEPSIKTLTLAPNAAVFLFHLCYASGNSEPGKTAPTLSVAKQRVDNYGSAFLAAGASAVIAGGHSHSGYIDALFTTTQPLVQMWRSVDSYNGHEIPFATTRSTGSAVLDPDIGPTNPKNFYRSIVGNLNIMTHTVTGKKLPPGVRGGAGVVRPTR